MKNQVCFWELGRSVVLFINTPLQPDMAGGGRVRNRFDGFRDGVKTIEAAFHPVRSAITPLKRGVNKNGCFACAVGRWLSTLALVLLPAQSAFAQLDRSLPPAEQAAAGLAVAEKWRDAAPAENAEYRGALKIRNPEGEMQTVPLTFRIIAGESSWQSIYEAGATPKTAAQKLVIIHRLGKPNEYLFAKGAKSGDPAGQLVSLTNDQVAVPFAGSDFWLIDLGLEFFHWPTQRLIRTEMRKGQVTKVLESINAHPVGGYRRVLTWLEQESGAPILAEAYDGNDKLMKQFSIKSVKKVKGQYQLQEMQISNPKTDSRTRIEYDFEKE